MHATKVMQKILSAVIAGLYMRNARNLFCAVEALFVGRRLTLLSASGERDSRRKLSPICPLRTLSVSTWLMTSQAILKPSSR
jgi:hypothetical protein